MKRYLSEKEKLQADELAVNGNMKEEQIKMVGQKPQKMPNKPSIAFALFKCFKSLFIPATIFKTTADLLQFVNPQILK